MSKQSGGGYSTSEMDTGSDLTFIRSDEYARLGSPPLGKCKLKFDGFGSAGNETWGEFTKILHVGSQIDLLCYKLTEISHNCEKEKLQKYIIDDIVGRHQRIIQFSKNIEKIFTYISLCQFVSNMLVICFISFILVVSSHLDQATVIIMKCFPYYIAVNCEAFILCYTGEYLTSKSEDITKSVYNFLWYELKPQNARVILLMILRSQGKLTLTAGKFLCLSLEAFANVRHLSL
ncbi:odorant receptor 85b-like [Bombus bifarius]|uniref:Odorant receptor 85b-like n=1 Tax=Bombus bifarius TaxID=103933 RepID=A0A6P8N8W8_9HYME|nr:odorant receptor 85b-like [Bombus bifarius]